MRYPPVDCKIWIIEAHSHGAIGVINIIYFIYDLCFGLKCEKPVEKATWYPQHLTAFRGQLLRYPATIPRRALSRIDGDIADAAAAHPHQFRLREGRMLEVKSAQDPGLPRN